MSKIKDLLLEKIQDKSIVIAVVGLGYVGLPLAVEAAKSGFQTIGFEVQESKVNQVNSGVNYIGDVIDNELKEVVETKMLQATCDFSKIADCDFIAICVPTPLDRYQQPDISFVKESTISVSKYLRKFSMVTLESTTYPGTTEELLCPILEEGSGLKCGEDFYLGFSPERVDPGNAVYKTNNTPKVVGAIGDDAAYVISEMYRSVLKGKIHTVSSPRVAEMEKILENTYRNINIGLVNELAILCDKMNIDIWEVIDSASTKPYGFQAFYPGPGLGGHCIPLDPYYLSWKAREFGFHTSLIEASMMVNDRMPEYCVERIAKVLNEYEKSFKGAKVLQLGIAYKQDIDDYRESPALPVLRLMENRGAEVDFYDPYIPSFKYEGKVYDSGLTELTEEALSKYDIVVITTAHKVLDYDFVQKNSKVIFDCKNACKNVEDRRNIVLL